MTSTLPPLVQAVSGAAGSALANALTYPLDLVTTRVQLQSPAHSKRPGANNPIAILHHIVKRRGWSALYNGIWTDTTATLLSNFFYFYFYSFLRKTVLSRKGRNLPPKSKPVTLTVFQELVLGWIAGIASRAISTPLNIVTLRLQQEAEDDSDDEDEDEKNAELQEDASSRPRGVRAVIQRIYEEEGLGGFWRGFETTMLLSLNPSLTLSLFQYYRKLLLLTQRHSIPTPSPRTLPNSTPLQAFVGGALSNSIAVALLYPLILAKTRLQAHRRDSDSPDRASLTSVLRDAYVGRSHGWGGGRPDVRGVYQGVEMQLMKGFLSQGVTLLVKGRIEQLIVQLYLKYYAAD